MKADFLRCRMHVLQQSAYGCITFPKAVKVPSPTVLHLMMTPQIGDKMMSFR